MIASVRIRAIINLRPRHPPASKSRSQWSQEVLKKKNYRSYPSWESANRKPVPSAPRAPRRVIRLGRDFSTSALRRRVVRHPWISKPSDGFEWAVMCRFRSALFILCLTPISRIDYPSIDFNSITRMNE